MSIKDYLIVLRTKHYIKNLLLFAPLLFSSYITTNKVIITFIGFISFCLMSSSVYIINDIHDYEEDKKNKVKKLISFDSVSLNKRIVISILCFIISIIITFLLNKTISFIYLILYFILNIIYTYFFKHIKHLNLICYIAFYILRLLYASSLLSLSLSLEIIVFTCAATLFVISNKKTKEKESNKKKHSYSLKELNLINILSLLSIIITYIIWIIKHYSILNLLSLIILISLLYLYNKSKKINPVDIYYSDPKIIILSILYLIIIIL